MLGRAGGLASPETVHAQGGGIGWWDGVSWGCSRLFTDCIVRCSLPEAGEESTSHGSRCQLYPRWTPLDSELHFSPWGRLNHISHHTVGKAEVGMLLVLASKLLWGQGMRV